VIRLTVTDIDTNINIKARLGLALNVANPINLSEGIYQIDYRITIKNYGNTGLEKIKLKENLSDVFPAPSAFAILNIQSSTGLILDPNFDGVNQLYLLDSNQNVINVGSSHTIDIRIQVQTNLSNVIYYNQVTALANAVNISIAAVDTSVDGLNPDPNNDSIPDEESPTIVEITVFVPSGFSPNGDGKNDEFKIKGIENYPNNKLEIYNRWGNKVFEQAPYDNTWRGDVKNTDAYIIGDGLLPSGTYFYLLDFGVPGMKQLSGYIVIRK
jgi:gliding motility-associated-like protein